MSEQYKMVAENPQSTVVSDYEPRYRTAKQYQSEAEMERSLSNNSRHRLMTICPSLPKRN